MSFSELFKSCKMHRDSMQPLYLGPFIWNWNCTCCSTSDIHYYCKSTLREQHFSDAQHWFFFLSPEHFSLNSFSPTYRVSWQIKIQANWNKSSVFCSALWNPGKWQEIKETNVIQPKPHKQLKPPFILPFENEIQKQEQTKYLTDVW